MVLPVGRGLLQHGGASLRASEAGSPLGNFQFGLVSGYLDGYVEEESGTRRFAFTWEGQDEMDPVTGSGWMRPKAKDEVEGVIKPHLGDRSKFEASRAD